MNFINQKLNRVSVRSFSDKKISQKDIDQLKKIINASDTCFNGQQFSAIFVNDKETKRKIYESVKERNSAKHVLECDTFVFFFADFNRINIANDIYLKNHKSIVDKKLLARTEIIDSLLYSVMDATIAAQVTVDAATSLGIDSCFTGSTSRNAVGIKKIFNLPDYLIPVVGVALGYASQEGRDKSEFEPKINKIYDNCYPQDQVKKEVEDFEISSNKYYLEKHNLDISYSKRTIEYYRHLSDDMFTKNIKIIWDNNWMSSDKSK